MFTLYVCSGDVHSGVFIVASPCYKTFRPLALALLEQIFRGEYSHTHNANYKSTPRKQNP